MIEKKKLKKKKLFIIKSKKIIEYANLCKNFDWKNYNFRC